MKKVLSLILAFLIVLGIAGCAGDPVVPPTTDPNAPTEGTIPDNTPVKPLENVIDLTGQTVMSDTITSANQMANGVQAYYTDGDHQVYRVDNMTMSMDLALTGNIVAKSVSNTKGQNYLINTLDTYVVYNGERVYSSDSPSDGRINTIKLGYYYYSVYLRDLVFGSSIPAYLEKAYHTYSDRMHQQFRIIPTQDSKYVSEFGFELKLRRDTIAALELADGSNVVTALDKGTYDYADLQYLGLDIKDVGVIGIITAGQDTKVTVTVTDKHFIIRQYLSPEGIASGTELTFANRLYNDETHSFDGIRKANHEEQNPLTDANISVEEKDGAAFLGYNHLTGAYDFAIDGMGFNDAYFRKQNKHFAEHITIKDADDRTVYLAVETIFPAEGAALVENGTLLPVPLQVGKNFGHEKEEPIYNPLDTKYGETIMPLVLKTGNEYDFTVLNVYQNWGGQGFKIKQLSSIDYFVSYYHLSTGVTETNCIAPYYSESVNGYFGVPWVLPDFRGASGLLWADVETQTGDPQYNSVGTLMAPANNKGQLVGEYANSDISYSGLTYADLDYSYVMPDGSYSFTMRHVEMPHPDESRTYYTIDFTFLKDTDINNSAFSIIGFDGRKGTYEKASYVDENGKIVEVVNPTETGFQQIYKLNKEGSFFAYYGLPDGLTAETGNFACLVKDYAITVGGQSSDVGLAFLNDFRNNPSFGALNYGSLTLDQSVSFKAGDTIHVDIILLPCGTIGQDDCQNAINVYNDSIVNPITVTATTGKAGEDTWIPTVIADNNVAEFTLTGGVIEGTDEVLYAVKAQGFTKLCKPEIYVLEGDQWVPYEFSSEHGYDGYGVLCEDGAVTYTFVFNQTAEGRSFKVVTP